ncbi:mycofactocin system glycosyltransferase [Antricoccus suffuscus]|uniref:Mycofactocin system glycosyltransferase n=1 Tax=Antricoccus suffuscus TaxID=1629062 RepID=A0A2T1A079_9ACTN|nr:mycofactocin biosynthesis glycosyltransferase MftF [Antricoccus suffuscus]PRZ42002.1 mycofactocin system glycosyltransferase [Antricoccus suffuscus]
MTMVPKGFVVRRDNDTRTYDGVLIGGSPRRALRLNPAAMHAWSELMSGPASSAGARTLARQLLETGMVHPVVQPISVSREVVTIVVPVRDRPQDLAACLAALRLYSSNVAIVVVDDASSDATGTAQIAGRYDADVVRLERNRGPAGARNAGLQAISTPIAAFVDSDCLVGARWLDTLVPHFDDPLVAAVAPRIVGSAAGTNDGTVGSFTREATPLDLGSEPANVTAQGRVSYVPSAVLLLRAVDFRFDESMRYGEDVDLVWRLRAAGWSVRYEPAVQVSHREPTTTTAWLRRRFDYGTSAAALDVRHPGMLSPAIFRPLPLAAATLALIARPIPAGVAAVLSFALYRRQLVARDLPTNDALRDSGRGVVQSVSGVTRWLQQFAPAAIPILMGFGWRQRGGRYAAVAAWMLPAYLDLRRRGTGVVNAPTYLAMQALDRAAYGAGVIAGARRHRRPSVILPRIVLPSRVRGWIAKVRR